MPLGTEVGLGSGAICYMETQLPPKRDTAPQFSARLFLSNGSMYQDTTWYEVRLSLGGIVLDGDPALPP